MRLGHGVKRVRGELVLRSAESRVVASAPGIAVIGQDQADAVMSAATILEDAGHQLVEISAEKLAAIAAESIHCAATVLTVSLAGWLDSLNISDEEVSPLAAAGAARGRATRAIELYEAAWQMARIPHRAWSLFGHADILLTPMLSGPPPAVGGFPASETDTGRHWAAVGALAPYAAFANVAGIPA